MYTQKSVIDILKETAERTDGYLTQYGVDLRWHLDPLGLKLEGSYGADKIERYISWGSLEQSVDPVDLIKTTEEYALRGLSS